MSSPAHVSRSETHSLGSSNLEVTPYCCERNNPSLSWRVTGGIFTSTQHSLSNLQSSVLVADQVEMDHGTGWERGQLLRGVKQCQSHLSGALPGLCWRAMHPSPCACTWPCSISMACTTTGPSEPQVCPSSSGQSQVPVCKTWPFAAMLLSI